VTSTACTGCGKYENLEKGKEREGRRGRKMQHDKPLDGSRGKAASIYVMIIM